MSVVALENETWKKIIIEEQKIKMSYCKSKVCTGANGSNLSCTYMYWVSKNPNQTETRQRIFVGNLILHFIFAHYSFGWFGEDFAWGFQLPLGVHPRILTRHRAVLSSTMQNPHQILQNLSAQYLKLQKA